MAWVMPRSSKKALLPPLLIEKFDFAFLNWNSALATILGSGTSAAKVSKDRDPENVHEQSSRRKAPTTYFSKHLFANEKTTAASNVAARLLNTPDIRRNPI